MAIWLGLLDANDLNAVTAMPYSTPGGFDSEEFNFQGLWSWEEAVIERIFGDCRTILIAAAGGGREAIALGSKGFEVTAFDCSETLTRAARTNLAKAGVKAVVLDSAPDDVPDGLGEYDGLLVGRGAYHHIPGRQRRIQFLKKCRAHLPANAPLFLDDFHVMPPDNKGLMRTAVIARFVRRMRSSQEPVELGDQLNPANFYHRFQREQMETELSEAGFQLELYATSPMENSDNLAHVIATAAKSPTALISSDSTTRF